MNISDEKEMCCTYNQNVLSLPAREVDEDLSPASHKEADTRICLHVAHCIKKGQKSVTIKTFDTDVVVLFISFIKTVVGLEELYIAFGTGKQFKILPIHQIVSNLGTSICKALPLFHALTGCDTTSGFNGRGKITCWDSWKSCPSLTHYHIYPIN